MKNIKELFRKQKPVTMPFEKKQEFLSIEDVREHIDESRTEFLSPHAKTLLKKYYCRPGETIQECFMRASLAYCGNDKDLAIRIYNYASKQWFGFASPVLSNAELPGNKFKSMPISCFLLYVEDSVKGLIEHTAETRWLTIFGGGIGGHWSDVRGSSSKSPGTIPFIHTIDADMLAYQQGTTRRGSYAAYLDITHPDIMEFITTRIPTGSENRKNLNIHNAVCLSDKFMRMVEAGGDWDLISPEDNETIVDTVPARELWESILETRYRTGEPYLFFTDTVNEMRPEVYKENNLDVKGSNLCSEIMLNTSPERTAVCCLSSLNLEKYDEWKDSTIVEDLVTMLDNVLQVFIDNAPDVISKAKYSAMRERSIGLGVMGYHSYLQRLMVPFESTIAREINEFIFANIKEKAYKQSEILAMEKGACPDMIDAKISNPRRNSHLLAIAPTANNSIIAGTSPSIEPYAANYFIHKNRIGSYDVKNVYLEKVLENIGKNIPEVWTSILHNNGSVQHLDFLSEHEKEVFKTAMEINQRELVYQAGQRQKYIDQGQSLNLFFEAGCTKKLLHDVHFQAWKQKLKTVYYLRTTVSRTGEKLGKIKREKLEDYKGDEPDCLACEG